jgi:hypothetical protein
VLDGELVIAGADGEREQFGSLQQRIHPAASRVNQLAESTPAAFVAFDILAEGKRRCRASRSGYAASCSRQRQPGRSSRSNTPSIATTHPSG